jgi:hypothetical protein
MLKLNKSIWTENRIAWSVEGIHYCKNFQKGHETDCSNYHGISLLWTFTKCYPISFSQCQVLYTDEVIAIISVGFSVTNNLLVRCKIWGFHGGDYEECRLLGYKIPVRTSQDTHYFSATESSQLMICKIWAFHGGDYEECRLLGCYAMWLL